MTTRNYKWLLVFFMFWLPLESGMAAVLSVCTEEKVFNDRVDKSSVEINKNKHHHDDCHNQVDDNHVLVNLSCDDIACDAYSHIPIIRDHAATLAANNDTVISLFNSGFISFIPEQPQRPPLTTFSKIRL